MTTHEKIHELIAVYRDLDEETRQLVDTHMETCENCAHALAETQRIDRALAELGQPAPDASLRDTFYREIGWHDEEEREVPRLCHLPTLLSAAAAVVIIVILVGVLNVLLRGAPERMVQLKQPERVPADVSLTETYTNQRLDYAIDYPPEWRVRESSSSSNIVSLYSYTPEEAPQRGDDFSPDQAKIEIVPMMSRAGVAPSLETMVSRVENDDEIEVLWREEWELSGGIRAVRMQITGTLAGENALLLTVINDINLHIQGYGDLSPFDEVVRTVRPTETDSTQ